jgi:ParB family transcriptional regulator, chromosome partitioning protein
MAKKNSLGRGLGALIENDEERVQVQPEKADAVNEIDIEQIETNPYQPRTGFDDESLQELASSIEKLGIIQPITVRDLGRNKFQIITGERRWRAAKLAGLKRIPAYVRTADDQGMLEMALVENIQREDLNSIEVAISYQRLVDECKLTQEELSERVGKKRSTITNYLRLLKLPAEMQLGIRENKLSMGHARALISIEDIDDQLRLYKDVIEKELSVRKTEELVRSLTEPEEITITQPVQKDNLPKEYEDLKDHLSRYFSTDIEFKRNTKGAGRIVIPFKTDEELEKIIAILDRLNA